MRPLSSRRARAGLATFAAALLLVLAACARGGEGGKDGDATTPSVDYHQPGDPAQVGTGFLVEMSLDGSAAYVQEEDARFPRPGCEGQPEPVMFRLPLAGGEREVLGGEQAPLNGDLIRGAGRRVAVVSGCEGFFERLLAGAETPDGRLTDLKEVPLSDSGEEVPPSPNSFAWSADGKHLLAASGLAVAEDANPSILRIDPSTGRWSWLFKVSEAPAISQVGQLADGAYVLAGDGRVTLRDGMGAIEQTLEGNGFAIAPDGRRIVVFGPALVLVTPGGPEPATLVASEDDRQITSATFSPDGRAIAYISSADSDNILRIVTPADVRVTEVAGPGLLGRAVFSGDGKSLAFNEFGGEALNFVAKVLLVRFGS